MSFFSMQFIFFYTVVFVIYHAVSEKYKNYVLLLSSYLFYMCFDRMYIFILLFVTGISFFTSILIGRCRHKMVLLLGIIICVCILAYFKFWNYLIGIVRFFAGEGSYFFRNTESIIMPIGLSFFVLEAIGYMIDVYNEKTDAERNIVKYALFLSFFPKITSGPIERATTFLEQVKNGPNICYERIKKGFFCILWGFFLKILIANRLGLFVDAAFSNPQQKYGVVLVMAVIMFGIQLYVDFSAYSYIAIGLAETFGYELTPNFVQPYFSQNIGEFWHRWHISLSTWLRDYVYIPLGGSRKGHFVKCRNLLITFLVSGVWHGTGMHYLFWGLLHGIYQLVFSCLCKNTQIRTINDNWIIRALKMLVTFVLVDFAWLFFRANSIIEAFDIISVIVNKPGISEAFSAGILSAAMWGQDIPSYPLIGLELIILLVVDIYHEKGKSVLTWLNCCNKIFRWSVYLIMVLLVILGAIKDFGVDASTFIYTRF